MRKDGVYMYDFDTINDQDNTQDVKHNQMCEYFGRDDLLPMWVAEMDFKTAPQILAALEKRVKDGIFGYTFRSDDEQQTLIDWYKKRYQVSLEPSMITYDTGVCNAIFEMIRIFSEEGDNICVPFPAYPQFERVSRLLNRKVIKVSLKKVENRYEFDFVALSKELSACKMMILCSPHNPGGRIWSKEELQEISVLCKKHHVVLLSDEIHCDLTMPNKHFISMLAIDDDCIIMNSVSKAFNMAGLQYSYSICKNELMNKKIAQHYLDYNLNSMNTLSMIAQNSAYKNGEAWLSQCCQYIENNYLYICEFLKAHDMNIPVFTLDAGYLLWMDFSHYFSSGDDLDKFLVETCHIATTFGRNFDPSCACYSRFNIATPLVNIKKAMQHLHDGLISEKLIK